METGSYNDERGSSRRRSVSLSGGVPHIAEPFRKLRCHSDATRPSRIDPSPSHFDQKRTLRDTVSRHRRSRHDRPTATPSTSSDLPPRRRTAAPDNRGPSTEPEVNDGGPSVTTQDAGIVEVTAVIGSCAAMSRCPLSLSGDRPSCAASRLRRWTAAAADRRTVRQAGCRLQPRRLQRLEIKLSKYVR